MTALSKNFSSKGEWLAAAVLTAAIVWLHVHFWLNAGGLWRDEVNLVNLAGSSSLAAMTHDSFPILMPLLVKFWRAFGDSDLQLRFFGMLCGLAIPLAFWIAAKTSRRPPLFGLIFFGLNPLLIGYGDSLRAYGLGGALIVFAFAAMWAFLQKPTWLRAALAAAAATFSVQALYQNAILFFAICLGAFVICLMQKNVSAALKIFCAGIVAAISLLPYWGTLAGLPQASIELRRGFSPFITRINFEMATGFPFERFTAVWEILAAIVIVAALLSLRNPNAGNQSMENFLPLFVGATLIALVVLFVGFLWFAAAGARPWYFLPPLALAAVCFDFGIPLQKFPRLARVAVFGFLAGIALISIPAANSDLRGHFTNVDKIARRLNQQAAPRDFVVVAPWFCGISFERYFRSAAPWQTLPPLGDHSAHRYDLVLQEMKNTNSLAPVFEKMSETLQSGHRVWVAGMLLEIPKANEPAPDALPPPPLKNSGWSDVPYSANWSAQVMWFLKNHSREFSRVDNETNGQVNFQEDLQLFMADGWQK